MESGLWKVDCIDRQLGQRSYYVSRPIPWFNPWVIRVCSNPMHYAPKKNQFFPDAIVPDHQTNVDLMVKDSKRFADSGGWGYAVFEYDAASDTFTPGTAASQPPQANVAKCGFACHTIVQKNDYVFTEYQHR